MEIWGFKVQFRLCPSPQFIQTSALYDILICTAAISYFLKLQPAWFSKHWWSLWDISRSHNNLYCSLIPLIVKATPGSSQPLFHFCLARSTTQERRRVKLGTTGLSDGRSVRNDALVERSVRRSRVAGRRVHTGLAEIGTTREEDWEAKWGKLKSLPLNALSNHQFLMQQNHQSIICCRSEGSHKTASSLLLFHRSPLLSFTCLHLNALWWWSIYYIAF